MKKNKIILIGLLSMMLTVLSCSEDDSNPAPKTITENKDEPNAYMGQWNGTFDGGDNGTWTLNIDSLGKYTGTIESFGTQTGYPINGTVSDSGSFNGSILVEQNLVRFIGQGKDGNSVSGTWINEGNALEGSWQGNKE
jgi:hypothetical protein